MTDSAARVLSASTTPMPCVPWSSLTTTGGPSTLLDAAGDVSACRV